MNILKTCSSIVTIGDDTYRVTASKGRGVKGLLITEVEMFKHEENTIPVQIDKLEDRESFDIDVDGLDFSGLEMDIWDTDNSELNLDEIDTTSSRLDDPDNELIDIYSSINNEYVEDRSYIEEKGNSFIIDLVRSGSQEDIIRLLNDSYYDKDIVEKVNVSNLNVDDINLEWSSNKDNTNKFDITEDKSSVGTLKDSILNNKTEKVTEYVNYKDRKYKFRDEKLVYHWVYRETLVDLDKFPDSFYDLHIKEYEFGPVGLAYQIMGKINDVLRLKLETFSNYEQQHMSKEVGGSSDFGTNYKIDKKNNLDVKTDKLGDDYYLEIFENISGRSIYREFYTEDFVCKINEKSSTIPVELYTMLITDVPYTEKENYGFSNKFKSRVKSGEVNELRFPDVKYFESILNLDYIKNADYRILRTEEDLKWFKSEIDKLHPDHVIAYDAETTGLKFHKWLSEDERDELVTHSFSWKDNQAVIIPVRMKDGNNVSLELVNKYVKPVMENRLILAHNGPADTLFNMYDKIDLNLVEDTYFLAKHLMPYLRVDEKSGKSRSLSRVTRSLEYLVRRTFNKDKINLKKYVFSPQGAEFDFSVLPDDYLIYYGCPDTDLLRQLWKVLRPKLRKDQETAYRATVRFAKLLAIKSSWPGIKLSEEIIIKNREKTRELTDLLENLALEVAGETKETLNIGSSKQLANYIYGKMKVPVTDRTKRTSDGDLSADKYVIEDLAEIKRATPSKMFKRDILDIDGTVLISADDLNMSKYPLMPLVRLWGDNNKNLTAYYDGLIKASYNGIYYPDPRVGSTATWRTTERTQITKSIIKDGLEPYNQEDYYMCSMDFSAEELRLAVNQSDDDGYKDILRNPENDPHRAAAAQIFNMNEYEVTHSIRAKAKTANFGIIYGMSGTRLAKQMAGTNFINADQLQDGLKVYNGYKYLYGRMLDPLNKASNLVREQGWLFNKLGYMMIYDDVLDIDDYESQIFDINRKEPPVIRLDPEKYSENVGGLKNKAGNYPIQSWAAGLLMFLTLEFARKLKENGIFDKVEIPLTVHDEIDLIVHKDVNPALLMKILKEVYETKLEGLGTNTIPLFVGIGFGHSWGSAKSDDAELPVNLQNIIVDEYNRGEFPKDLKPSEIPKYFWDRKVEYLRSRLKEVLKEELDTKYFHYAEVKKKLRIQIFVLNQCADVFKIYNSKTQEYFYDRILEAICDGEEFSPDDFEINEDEVIEEEDSDDEKAMDFFFNPIIHERLTILGDTVTLDINGLGKEVVKTLILYMGMYNTDDKEAKNLIIKIGDQTRDTGIRITGLPFNAKDIIEGILNYQIDETNFNIKKKTVNRVVNGIDIKTFIKKDVEKNIFTVNINNINKNLGWNFSKPDKVANKIIKSLANGGLIISDPEDVKDIDYNLDLTITDSNGDTHTIETSIYLKNITLETMAKVLI